MAAPRSRQQERHTARRCTSHRDRAEPGVEIGIGGLTLIAESRRWVELREFLARLLGWRSDRTEVVDHALRSIRMAATRRVALVLCGDGDLVPIARAIHRRALGADRPFIVCDRRRRQHKATVRSPENYETGMPAFAAATGGSLCVRSMQLPRGFSAVVTALRDPRSQVQLMVCARTSKDCEPYLVVPITVPPLASRFDELDRIIVSAASIPPGRSGDWVETMRGCADSTQLNSDENLSTW